MSDKRTIEELELEIRQSKQKIKSQVQTIKEDTIGEVDRGKKLITQSIASADGLIEDVKHQLKPSPLTGLLHLAVSQSHRKSILQNRMVMLAGTVATNYLSAYLASKLAPKPVIVQGNGIAATPGQPLAAAEPESVTKLIVSQAITALKDVSSEIARELLKARAQKATSSDQPCTPPST